LRPAHYSECRDADAVGMRFDRIRAERGEMQAVILGLDLAERQLFAHTGVVDAMPAKTQTSVVRGYSLVFRATPIGIGRRAVAIDLCNGPAYRNRRVFRGSGSPFLNRITSQIGEWCNGSTTDSDSVSLGSNPSSPAFSTSRKSKFRTRTHGVFCDSSLTLNCSCGEVTWPILPVFCPCLSVR
jgi:hypothetical protein